MSVLRRVLFWIILCLFIGSTAAFLAWTPYREEALYRAIPADAVFVSAHRNLAGRWQDLARHPAVRNLLGPEPARTEHAGRRRSGNRLAANWLRLAKKETVIAYIPAQGPGRGEAWICASWIGSSSCWRRWALCLLPARGLERLPGHCNGRPTWRWRQPLTAHGERLSLAFGEGIILACLSRDPGALRRAILAYDGLAPSAASAPALHPGRPPLDPLAGPAAPAAADRGWVRWLRPGSPPDDPLLISYALTRLDAERLSADIGIHPGLEARAPLVDSPALPALANLLGDTPALLLILPLDLVRDQADAASDSTHARFIRTVLKHSALPARGNHVFLALLSGDYSGAMGKEPFRVRVPTLLVGVQISPGANLKRVANEIVDVVNAHYRLGLIIDPAPPAGQPPIAMLETTRSGLFAGVAAEDRPAYAVADGWLIFSSHAGSLRQLLGRRPEAGARSNALPARWQAKLEAGKPSALLWADLDVCGRVLQLPLTVLAISRRGQPEDAPADPNRAIKALKTWLEHARPLKTGALWMDANTPAPGLHLEIGEGQQ